MLRGQILNNASVGQMGLDSLLSPFLRSPALAPPIIGADGSLYVPMNGELHAIK